MKFIKEINNFIINESNESKWEELAISRLSFSRETEIKEFFLEVTDLGLNFLEVANNHTILDENFELLKRINYVDKPLYMVYEFDISNKSFAKNVKNLNNDNQMDMITSLFSELGESFIQLRSFGFKFRLSSRMSIDSILSGTSNSIQMLIYHTDDIVPWEMIFSKE